MSGSPKRSIVRTNAEGRPDELVRAAYRLIAEHGFEGLRTRDVAKEVGVNIATLHYYFPTKESLIRAVAEHALNRFRTTLAPKGEPKAQLRTYMRATQRLLRDEPELGAVMSELALRSMRDAETRKILDEMYAVWHTTVRGLLRRSAEAGVLRPGVDAEAAAELIAATLGSLAVPPSHGRGGALAVRQLEKLLLKESIN